MIYWQQKEISMKEILFLKTEIALAGETKSVEFFLNEADGMLQHYHCIIGKQQHVNIEINDDADWTETDGQVTTLSRTLGELIENKAA